MVLQTAFSLKDTSKKTDEELAEIAKNGDKDALEYFFRLLRDCVKEKNFNEE